MVYKLTHIIQQICSRYDTKEAHKGEIESKTIPPQEN